MSDDVGRDHCDSLVIYAVFGDIELCEISQQLKSVVGDRKHHSVYVA